MALTRVLFFFLQVEAIIVSLRRLNPMRRKRKIIGIILSGLFLAYFSASFIFVPRAPGLQDWDTSIVKLENHDGSQAHRIIRSSSEHSEEAFKIFNDFTVSFLESFHTGQQQSKLESLENSQGGTYDIYLSLRRLRI